MFFINKKFSFKFVLIIGVCGAVTSIYTMDEEYDKRFFYRDKFKKSVTMPEKTVEKKQQSNFFLMIPKEIRNHIVQYLLWQEENERINNCPYPRGMQLYPTVQELDFKKLKIHRDKHGSLFFTDKTQGVKQLFAAEGSTWKEYITSFGGISLMYRSQQKVAYANVSPNKQFVVFLVALYNDITEDFYPISLHVINLLQKTKSQKELLLRPLIESSDTCWKKNRVAINPNDSSAQKRLEQEGYIHEHDTSSSRGAERIMSNDIISLALDNEGRIIAIAYQTGIMIIDMEKESISRVVNENMSAFQFPAKKLLYGMEFDQLGTNLLYRHPSQGAIEIIAINSEKDQLTAYFKRKGVCKNLFLQDSLKRN